MSAAPGVDAEAAAGGRQGCSHCVSRTGPGHRFRTGLSGPERVRDEPGCSGTDSALLLRSESVGLVVGWFLTGGFLQVGASQLLSNLSSCLLQMDLIDDDPESREALVSAAESIVTGASNIFDYSSDVSL